MNKDVEEYSRQTKSYRYRTNINSIKLAFRGNNFLLRTTPYVKIRNKSSHREMKACYIDKTKNTITFNSGCGLGVY